MKNSHYPDWYLNTHKTWVQVLEETCTRFPNKEYIVFNDERITYGEFYEKVNHIAGGLLELGVKKGDVVAVWMPNCPEWMQIQFAIYKIGGILLPLYTYYRTMEVEYALKQSEAKVLFMKDDFLGKIDAAEIMKDICPEIESINKEDFNSEKLPNLKTIISLDGKELIGRYDFSEIVSTKENSISEVNRIVKEISPFDVMNIMYTSGTTGFPKGGMSMHRTNLATVYHWTTIANVSERTVILGQVPLFTNFGGLYVGPLAMLRGAKVILTEYFNAENSLRLIEQESVTYIPGSPSMFIMLLEHRDFGIRDVSSLTTGHVAGAPLSPELMNDIIHKMGVKNIMQAYGLSECGGIATVTSSEDEMDKRLETVGKPLPSAQVKVVDIETQETIINKPGEIWLHDVLPGSCVGKGYWRMPDKTDETTTKDGWFKTGDIGIMGTDGYLRFVGRLKEMFTVGGFNVYPAEIENFIQTHPDVQEVHVIGVPDHRLGEVPMAWIRLKQGVCLSEESMIEFVKKNLSSQKVPRYVQFFGEGELPMTGSGKIQKFKLRERAINDYQLTN
ncbi:AMP-binding protein [Bacillus sp. 1P02SD]|uniref:AMP-binding protein n=1 Tax=Bacillus sp. 1P02SD TaxID=3132264 RepID=UPI0039A0AE9B